jgi:mercuric reductase
MSLREAADEARTMKQTHYDLVILGSGSTGFAAALRAQELGKTSVMTEERTTGGTCVNRGCLPSKNLIEAARIIHDARYPHGYEPEVGQAIWEVFEKEGIKVVTSVVVRSVRQDGKQVIVKIETGTQRRELRAEKLLVATGRRPNSDRIAIEKTRVELGNEGQIRVDQFLRTNVPRIFAGGDVIGPEVDSQMATPVGSQDGGIIAHNAFADGEPRRVSHRVIPRAIFTNPQIATVGLTEKEAISRGHNCWCNTVPLSLVPRAGAIRDTAGMIKMVADADTEEVLGVAMVGHTAGEVIHEAAMAMRFRAKINDFIELLHVYPTMAEALKIVAISRRKDPAKLSCCAE